MGFAHPHFDDQGAVAWFKTLRDALAAAKAEKKRVLVHMGRLACGSCRRLVESVIPRPEVRDALNRSWVCLASDVDVIEPALLELAKAHVGHFHALPFVLFLDDAGKFLHGTEGGYAAPGFLADLERFKA